MAKFERLLAVSDTAGKLHDKFRGRIYLWEREKALVATNGHTLLFDRTHYKETKVISRMLNNANVFTVNSQSDALEVANEYMPNLEAIGQPNKEYIKHSAVTIPEWFGNIGKTKQPPALLLTKKGKESQWVVAFKPDEKEASIPAIDARYMRMLAGDTAVDVYMPATYTHPIFILPENSDYAKSDWVGVIMPIRLSQ